MQTREPYETDQELIEYLEREKLSGLMAGILIRLALSIAAVVGITRTSSQKIDLIGIIALLLIGAMVYALCKLFVFSLQMTHNYLIAVGVFIGLLMVGTMGFDKLVNAFPGWENTLSVLLLVLLSFPLLVDLRRVVRYFRT